MIADDFEQVAAKPDDLAGTGSQFHEAPNGAGAELIDGAATYVLTAQWQFVRLVSNGAGRLVV